MVGHRSIDIGDDVYTGPNVYITDQNHGYDDPDVPIGKQWPSEAPVRIGPGCWIGANAVVLPGTVLGRNVVVAAGSVVRGEFPDHCVVGGVPARMLRRYAAETGWARVDSSRPRPRTPARPTDRASSAPSAPGSAPGRARRPCAARPRSGTTGRPRTTQRTTPQRPSAPARPAASPPAPPTPSDGTS
ncbi:acyltransferase [Catenulispora yoronensis]